MTWINGMSAGSAYKGSEPPSSSVSKVSPG